VRLASGQVIEMQDKVVVINTHQWICIHSEANEEQTSLAINKNSCRQMETLLTQLVRGIVPRIASRKLQVWRLAHPFHLSL
jgi:hypothetical protein